MDNLELLKILLQEKKYPYFDDTELQVLLESNDNDVYLTASKLALMKANGDKSIKVGPITIEGPGAEYWINLSNHYNETSKNNNSSIVSSGYKTTMARCDGQ
ncbi:hypothetical protein [Clostridium sp. UBA3061]|uniref:hypothetical protein n=1 Tax=Clostridium sp. UBA3061 TaxID=1946353 RepID=UPI003217B12C